MIGRQFALANPLLLLREPFHESIDNYTTRVGIERLRAEFFQRLLVGFGRVQVEANDGVVYL